MTMDLSSERALVFRITHIANVPWILDHGLHCASSEVLDPDFRPIGLRDLIDKRAPHGVPVAPGGTLSDYVAFYFTPRSPMLYNIKTGHNVTSVPMSEIVVLVSSLHTLREQDVPFLFTDRHAYLGAAQYSADLEDLERIDWRLLSGGDFSRSVDDPGKMERYQSEALVHRHVPVTAILGIACHNDAECGRINKEVTQRGLDLDVITRQRWYF